MPQNCRLRTVLELNIYLVLDEVQYHPIIEFKDNLQMIVLDVPYG
jgi:hypothetical protein